MGRGWRELMVASLGTLCLDPKDIMLDSPPLDADAPRRKEALKRIMMGWTEHPVVAHLRRDKP